MKNPLIPAREALQLTQHDLATILGVSQQFIQRIESGASFNVPIYLNAYYNNALSLRQRLDLYADLLEAIPSEIRVRTIYPQDSLGQIYRTYCTAARNMLPNLRPPSHLKTREEVYKFWCHSIFSLTEASSLQLAQAIHVNPNVIDRYFRNPGLSIVMFPDSLGVAINETGKLA